MEFQKLFWVDGDDEDDDKDASPTEQYVAVTPPQTKHKVVSLIQAHTKLLPDELVFFEKQMKLFEKTTSVASQLVTIVMVTVSQKFPNVTQRDIVAMYEANKPILVQLQREQVDLNDGVIDNKSAATRAELGGVIDDIGVCKDTLLKLEVREDQLLSALTDFTKQKQAFTDKIGNEHSKLLRHIEAHIKILTNYSEET